MATLPDERALGERPVPQSVGGVASYNVPGPSNRGSALAGAGSQIAQAGDIIEQTNQKWDAISAEDAYNKLKEKTAQLEFDPQVGFKNARGANAIGQDFNKQYMSQFTDAASGIADSLTNQQQKQMFQQRVGIAQAQFQGSLLQHQAAQTTAFANDTDNATVKNGLNAIAANPYDDDRYQTEMMGINASLAAKFSRNGYSSDMAKSEMDTIKSAALASRTSGMMLDDPLKAASFFHAHEFDFEPSQRLDLARQLKTTTDAQTSRADGAAAYAAVKGGATDSLAQAPLPQNMNADTVHPYAQADIDNLVKQVKEPSKYDSMITAAATKFNVSPNELKLRIMAESGGRPDAVSSAGAVGLGQLTEDTAKRLGVTNRMDPEQSINASAQLMASYGGTVGGDMSKVDQMYYGPGTPNGPNTKQYVENLRAVRTQLFGAAQSPPSVGDIEAMEGKTIENAKALANAKRPGDLVYQDQVVAEARKNWSNDLGVKRATDYSNFSTILQSSIGGSGARSLSDLSPQQQMVFAQLPPQNQHSLMTLWDANQRGDDRGDKIVQNEATDRKTLTLMGQALNDPVAFKGRDIASDIQDLPLHQQNQVMTAWMSIDKNMAKGANYQHAISILRPAMNDAKITDEKSAPQHQKDDFNAYTALIGNAMDNFMENNKRSPTDSEIRAIGAPLLAQATVKGASYFGFGSKTESIFQLKPDEESRASVAMDPAEKTLLTQRLQSRYGYAPTESQIQAAKVLSILHPNDTGMLSAFDRSMKTYKPQPGQTSSGVIK